MALAGTATVDVQLTGSAIRLRALELALENAPNGRSFNAIICTAKQFADFITDGTTPEEK